MDEVGLLRVRYLIEAEQQQAGIGVEERLAFNQDGRFAADLLQVQPSATTDTIHDCTFCVPRGPSHRGGLRRAGKSPQDCCALDQG